ncbi:Peptidase M23 [Thermocrinis albus DSM 14484]|uniref:Peptidase M23 n=1 Tax=Thermocrinis albus (strain DSM 14484 / JCM 11386 / HI 11/12) TaxID=638303 RepID=D3SM13_THEAH|nr:M23 family metallopeptidase [Thermocrinis albus]ADC89793.1 Peptidase M23 [Thermocrinis albus DSM 14484]
MRKMLAVLLLLGGVSNTVPVVNSLGVGGPSEDPFPIPPDKDINLKVEEDMDTQKVRDIVEKEISLSEAMQELANVKTVEMARPDIWPVVGIITSDYGWRTIGGSREFHTGVDISAPYGAPVSVSADGRVIFAGWLKGYGKTVIVYHGYGFVTLYAHLSSILVDYGERVVKGQVIGKVGSTGRAFGTHLHYEVLKYGIRQNPIAYLP